MHNRVTLIGCGRLGVCLALCMERAGYDVLAVDIASEYVASLNDRTFVSSEPQVNELLRNSIHFRATTNLDEGIDHSDLLYVLVDTPSTGGDRHYDTEVFSDDQCPRDLVAVERTSSSSRWSGSYHALYGNRPGDRDR